MKVHELKEILNNYDDTADVFFFTGYSTIPYYELLDRQAEYFNQSKIKALVAPVKKVKKW